MEERIRENVNKVVDLLTDTKKEVALKISEDVMKGIFIVSEENKALIQLITDTTNNFNAFLEGTYNEIKEVTVNIPKVEKVETKEEIIKETIVEQVEEVQEVEEDLVITKEENNIIENEENNNSFDELSIKEDEEVDNNENVSFFSGFNDNYNEEYNDTGDNEEENNEKSIFDIKEEDIENMVLEEEKEDILIPREENPIVEEIEINESRKLARSFIYNNYRIMATHYGFNSSSDISLYIAPLEVKKNNPNVPIVVHAYSHGKCVTASSYDTKDTGHAIVTIEIDEFYLLCRGAFDENGKFTSYVMTTGVSANQGDKINIVNKEEGYVGPNPIGCGHIKFKDEENTYEIFPLSLVENEYLCILISKEFLDYHIVAKTYGTPKIKFYSNGLQKEVVAGWSGDYFEADIV